MSRSFSDKQKTTRGARFQFELLEPRQLFSVNPLAPSSPDLPPIESNSAAPLLGEQADQGLANFAWLPMVFAGPNKVVAISDSLLLTGEVIVDANINLSLTWSKVSGPGNASFGSASGVSTSVNFDQAGTYELSIAATNNGMTSSASLTVTVVGPTPLPDYERWVQDMLTFGRQHGEWLIAHQNDIALDPPLASTYYDAARVFYQIADYTGDATWNTYAEAAISVYRDRYAVPRGGVVPGYWNFTRGLAMDYERTGNIASRDAVILLSTNASYAADSAPLPWTDNCDFSREVAYAMMSYLDAERVGAPRRARLDALSEQALGHLDQWFIQESDPDYAPFMFALTADALMQYYERIDQDPRIIEKLAMGADWTWQNAWQPDKDAFYYRANDTSVAAPDLNLLIAPVYEWLYHKTGEAKYRTQGDQIFSGGVTGAWLSGAKQFNQNYRVSFDFIAMRLSQHASQVRMPQSGMTQLRASTNGDLNFVFAPIYDSFVTESDVGLQEDYPLEDSLSVEPGNQTVSDSKQGQVATSEPSDYFRNGNSLATGKTHSATDHEWSELADFLLSRDRVIWHGLG
ncbi:hypothetical protein I41_25410 [Lacipirellula limnantheis]|uniref:PKD domain-containing protein n=2 Tax=Lacipirellula limnantheis TaxID=2528024 RepID=A0A517TYA5_9BACT|nr:hypothetical protein I41_25410 [Lacipirellula limnantheis]